MTLPIQAFSAHIRSRQTVGQREQFSHPLAKAWRSHVIGIISKTPSLQCLIRGILSQSFPAKTTKLLSSPTIADFFHLEPRSHGTLVKLRVTGRLWPAPNIDKQLNVVSLEESKKGSPGMVGVPDRPDPHLFARANVGRRTAASPLGLA